MGKPNPPRKPVVAGLTASIDSIAGLEIILKNMSAMITVSYTHLTLPTKA